MARFCKNSERLVTAVCQWNVPLSAISSMCLAKGTGYFPRKVKDKGKLIPLQARCCPEGG